MESRKWCKTIIFPTSSHTMNGNLGFPLFLTSLSFFPPPSSNLISILFSRSSLPRTRAKSRRNTVRLCPPWGEGNQIGLPWVFTELQKRRHKYISDSSNSEWSLHKKNSLLTAFLDKLWHIIETITVFLLCLPSTPSRRKGTRVQKIEDKEERKCHLL